MSGVRTDSFIPVRFKTETTYSLQRIPQSLPDIFEEESVDERMNDWIQIHQHHQEVLHLIGEKTSIFALKKLYFRQ